MKTPEMSKADVDAAVKEINLDGVPKRRRSTKFCLQVGARHYPPKYVLALAVRNATGKTLLPADHSGGARNKPQTGGPGVSDRPVLAAAGAAASRKFKVYTMIGRIIIDGPPVHPPFVEGREMEGVARDLLSCAFESWPTDQQARFVITPGGFLKSDLPSGLSGRSGWDSVAGDFALLQRAAEAVVRRVVSPRVLKLAKGKVASLTIGIDLGEFDGQHAELVAFIRIADGKVLRWTGKSYPTATQERRLIQVLDFESHCLRFEGERVLVLGCHDLNMFSPRGWNNQVSGGHRRERCRAVRSIVSEFRPTVVLHHPHTTDSPRIWMQSWAFLTERR